MAIGPPVFLVLTTSPAAGFGMKELLEAVEARVLALLWPGTANRIFAAEGAVKIVPAETVSSNHLPELRIPACLLYDAGGEYNIANETADFQAVAVGLSIITRHDGDKWGTAALLGTNRVADTSQLVGITELRKQVTKQLAVHLRSSVPAVQFVGMAANNAPTGYVDQQNRQHVKQDFTLRFCLLETQ